MRGESGYDQNTLYMCMKLSKSKKIYLKIWVHKFYVSFLLSFTLFWSFIRDFEIFIYSFSLLSCMCIHVCVCICVWVPTEVRVCQIPQIRSHRRLWTTELGCWRLSSGPLQEQNMLFTGPLLQLLKFCMYECMVCAHAQVYEWDVCVCVFVCVNMFVKVLCVFAVSYKPLTNTPTSRV